MLQIIASILSLRGFFILCKLCKSYIGPEKNSWVRAVSLENYVISGKCFSEEEGSKYGTLARISVNYVYYSAHEQYIQNASLYPEAEFMNGVQSSLRFLGIILRVLRLEVSVWIS